MDGPINLTYIQVLHSWWNAPTNTIYKQRDWNLILCLDLRMYGTVRVKKWVISLLMLVFSNDKSNSHKNSCSVNLLYTLDMAYDQYVINNWKVRFPAMTRGPY